jgi:surface protein
MGDMFSWTKNFNKNLSNWDVSNVTNCEGFSHGAFSWELPKPNFTNCNPYHS